MAVIDKKSSVFCDITPLCSQLKVNRRFESCYLLHARFLFGLFFYPRDGSEMFLLTVGSLSNDYKLRPRRQNSLLRPLWEPQILHSLLLLSECNQNWNVWTNVSKILQYYISWKFIHLFSCRYRRCETDTRRWIFTNFRYTCTNYRVQIGISDNIHFRKNYISHIGHLNRPYIFRNFKVGHVFYLLPRRLACWELSRLVLRRISAGLTAFLLKSFHVLPQSLQVTYGLSGYLIRGHDRLLSNP
jgi:hypothetical protein